MSGKTLYEVLGVPADATQKQLRQAYMKQIKVLHPDRFDQARQREKWEEANEKLKELNHAYGVLREEGSRAQYNLTIAQWTFQSPTAPQPRRAPPPQRPSPGHVSFHWRAVHTESTFTQSQWEHIARAHPRRSIPPEVKLGRMKAGSAYFGELPRSIQKRLRARITGADELQYTTPLGGMGWNYFRTAALFAWPLYLFFSAADSHWDSYSKGWFLAVTLVVAFIHGQNLNRIIGWLASPLRSHLLITPLYIMKTKLDRVWYWPVWELADIRGIHNLKNGAYQGTSLHLTFRSGHKETFTISPESAYAEVVQVTRGFQARCQTAKARNDVLYFYEKDDFREFIPPVVPRYPRRKYVRTAAVFAFSFVIFGLLYTAALYSGSTEREREMNFGFSSSRSR